MSQTETLLLVVLGFALATLIALFAGRLLWAAALKLGARRMQKQVPTTLVGLQTERDRLRAEYAMLSQRLGSRLEATKLKMAEQMAEVSRHRNRLELLEAEIQANDKTITGLQEQLTGLNEQLTAARTVEAELQQTIAEKQAALELARRALDEELSRPTLPPQPVYEYAEPGEPNDDPQRRLRSRIDRLNQIAQTVAADRERTDALDDQEFEIAVLPESPPGPPADPLVIAKLQEAEQETGDLQKELELLDAEWSKRLDEMKDSEEAGAQSPQGSTSVANVISLANRIRDLKKGLGTG